MPREKWQRHSRSRMTIGVLCALASLLGCGSLGPERTAAGAWFGYDGNRKVSLFISETDGEITGSGSIENPRGTIRVTSGMRSGDQISFQTEVEYAAGASFGSVSGSWRSGRIAARLAGAAFAGDTITLSRWP